MIYKSVDIVGNVHDGVATIAPNLIINDHARHQHVYLINGIIPVTQETVAV